MRSLVVQMSGVPRPMGEPAGGQLRRTFAVDIDNLAGKLRNPGGRSSGSRGHSGKVPVRNQNCAVRNGRLGFEQKIALSTQLAAPLHLAPSLQLEESFENVIFVQQRKIQCRSQVLCQSAFPAAGKPRNHNETLGHLSVVRTLAEPRSYDVAWARENLQNGGERELVIRPVWTS